MAEVDNFFHKDQEEDQAKGDKKKLKKLSSSALGCIYKEIPVLLFSQVP